MFSAKPEEFAYIKEMVTQADFDKAIENPDKATIIQAGAAWCGPCKVLKPKLVDAVKKAGGQIEFLYVDVDKHQSIA